MEIIINESSSVGVYKYDNEIKELFDVETYTVEPRSRRRSSRLGMPGSSYWRHFDLTAGDKEGEEVFYICTTRGDEEV